MEPSKRRAIGSFRVTPRPSVTHPPSSSGRQMTLDVSYREGFWPKWEVAALRSREHLWLVHWRLRSKRRSRYTCIREPPG